MLDLDAGDGFSEHLIYAKQMLILVSSLHTQSAHEQHEK